MISDERFQSTYIQQIRRIPYGRVVFNSDNCSEVKLQLE